MPDRKLLELCERITKEQDPKKMSALIDQLSKLLSEDRETIKAKIEREGLPARKAAS